jgi:hypothetical protein
MSSSSSSFQVFSGLTPTVALADLLNHGRDLRGASDVGGHRDDRDAALLELTDEPIRRLLLGRPRIVNDAGRALHRHFAHDGRTKAALGAGDEHDAFVELSHVCSFCR